MSRPIRVAGAILLLITLAWPASASAAPMTQEYGSCRTLVKDFPNGVARNAAASYRAYSHGYIRPKIMRHVYDANARLDRDRDGVVCENRG